jgi:hypothetical protein
MDGFKLNKHFKAVKKKKKKKKNNNGFLGTYLPRLKDE